MYFYYEYDEWGNLLAIVTATEGNAQQMNVAMANPLRYRGYYYDSETGYYYLQSRYYDPSICRFINADTSEYLGNSEILSKWNLFSYCGNNPTNNYDYDGHWECKVGFTYLKIVLNDWETALLVKAILLGTAAIDFLILAIASPANPTAWATIATISAAGVLIAAYVDIVNHLGRNKGIYIKVGFSIRGKIYVNVGWNKKDPNGFYDTWDIYTAIRKHTTKIIKKVGANRIRKLALKSKTNQVCVLAQMLYDNYCNKEVVRRNYYIV